MRSFRFSLDFQTTLTLDIEFAKRWFPVGTLFSISIQLAHSDTSACLSSPNTANTAFLSPNMATLKALPNELLILVFTKCPDIRTAVRLSEVDRSLRTIWLENIAHIAKEVLEPVIPAYNNALELAKYESDKEASFAQAVIPRLLQNAELARSTCAEWEAHIPTVRADIQRYIAKSRYIPGSYYLIRRLVHAYSDLELQAKLYPIAYSSSTTEAQSHRQLATFMTSLMNHGEKVRQGMEKDRHLWTEDDEEYGWAVKDEWEFASDVCELLDCEIRSPAFSALELPCPWRFGTPCCGEDCRRGETWPENMRPSSE